MNDEPAGPGEQWIEFHTMANDTEPAGWCATCNKDSMIRQRVVVAFDDGVGEAAGTRCPLCCDD